MREAISRRPPPSDPRQLLPVHPQLPHLLLLIVVAAVTVAVDLTTRVIAVAQRTVASVLFHETPRPLP